MSGAKRKRSLADDIAELFSAAPNTDIDVEDELAFGLGGKARVDDVDAAAEDFKAQRPSRRAPEKGLRLRAPIAIDAPEYAGRRVSRSEFWEGEVENGDEPSGAGANGEVNDDEAEPSGSDDDDGDEISDDDEGVSDDDEYDDGGGEDEDDDAEDDDDEPPKRARGSARRAGTAAASSEGEDELAELEAELERVRASEAEAVAALQQRAAQDRERGLNVKAQRALWEKTLETRIWLQKGVTAGVRIPTPAYAALAAQRSAEVAEALSSAADAARDTLEGLCELRSAIAELNPEVAELASASGTADVGHPAGGFGGVDADALWQRLELGFGGLRPFIEGSLDKWHARSSVAAGGPAGKSGFKALNQSVSQQVASFLSDPARAARRAAAPLTSAPRRLVEPRDLAVAAPASRGLGADPEGDPRDPDAFDDTEFYAQLLKEYLEVGADGGLAGAIIAPRKKVRKVVDRRASKGRKIRYHVMEKLVNFMAPQPLELPPMAEQLLGRLFGDAMRPVEVAGAIV